MVLFVFVFLTLLKIYEMATFLFFDVETTGLPNNFNAPLNDFNNWPRLVQIAWIYSDGETVLEEKMFIIKPSGFMIPVEASDIHGITTEKALSDGFDIEKVLSSFNEIFDEADYLVAHNIEFDSKIIGSELVRNGYKNVLDTKAQICTMKSSTDYCALEGHYGFKWPKLSELYFKLFGSDFFGAHDALADIRATCKCFWELIKLNIINIEPIEDRPRFLKNYKRVKMKFIHTRPVVYSDSDWSQELEYNRTLSIKDFELVNNDIYLSERNRNLYNEISHKLTVNLVQIKNPRSLNVVRDVLRVCL